MSTNQPQPDPVDPTQQGPQYVDPLSAPPPFPNTPGHADYQAPQHGYPHDRAQGNPYASPAGYPGSRYGLAQPTPTPDERLWAIGSHLSAVLSTVVSVGWLTWVGPLIVYFLQKDQSAYARRAAAGAFNFTLSMWLVSIVGWILTVTLIGAIIGIPMIIIGMLGPIVMGIVGAVKASNGQAFDYPMQLKVLS